MARMGIDCRFATAFGGLGRYTRELVTALLHLPAAGEYTLFVQDENEEWLSTIRSSTTKIIEAPYPHYSLQEQLHFPRILSRSKIDLLFVPHFNVPLFCPVPYVITVHDLILHRYPNQASFLKRIAYRLVMRHAVHHAKRIITVSHFTQSELTRAYPKLLPERLQIVTEGVHERFTPQSDEVCRNVREKFSLEKPFFLSVGNAKEHKNIRMLIDAFHMQSDSACELVLVTGGKEAENLREENGVRILRDVTDGDLPALYSSATALVTASLYEGFCLPIAEAQACGCPVIATNTSAIPEIASTSALLLEPTVEAFAKAFVHPPIRPVSRWDPPRWQSAAEKTHAILTSVLSSSHGSY